MNNLLAPSILSSDFLHLGKALDLLERSEADLIHCDVMDGHFVPNLSFGPPVIRQIRAHASLPLDVHLMLSNPEAVLDQYIDAGAGWLSFQYETAVHHQRALSYIKSKGVKAGIVLNPSTPVESLRDILPDCDYVLLMSVNPGFSGQSFIPQITEKIKRLSRLRQNMACQDLMIEIDGGVNTDNISELKNTAPIFLSPVPQSFTARIRKQ
ncbi:MAG: ribulose-phosphate 3-epimerase [Candidatus Marinimicrobia bacterium]|nr:ribulose-phosphate 3-epimerase [Candidatus Neomarinimicrobiota bacterium]